MPDIRRESHIEEFPTLKEELQRKAFEQMERLVLQLDRGEIGPAQFDTGISTIWNCVSGLVDKNLADLICEIKEHKPVGFDYTDSRVFVKDDAMAFLYRKYGGSDVLFKVEDSKGIRSNLFSHDEKVSPSLGAKKTQDRMTQTFIANGWKRKA